MQSRLLFLLVMVLCAVAPVRAASPDDQYLGIYYLIQEADAASAAGRNADALGRYDDALRSLQSLQKVSPNWEPNVVAYRLRYLGNRIAVLKALGAQVPVVARPAAEDSKAVPAAPAGGDAVTEQLKALQTDVQRLQGEKGALQVKLQEALSAQPAAVDPQTLARVEDRVRELSKENELLRTTVANAAKAPVPDNRNVEKLRKETAALRDQLAAEQKRAQTLAAEKVELEDRLGRLTTAPRDETVRASVRRKLDETTRQLAQQKEQATQLSRTNQVLEARLRGLEADAANAKALRAENDLLKRQVADLKRAGGDDVASRLASAEAQIASLIAERKILQLERTALENRLEQLQNAGAAAVAANETATAKRLKAVTRERDDLQKQLETVTKELEARRNRAATERVQELESQVAALQARLKVLEAKPVPYSDEELALFRAPVPKLVVATDTPAKGAAVIPKPPAGTGPLVTEAQRAFASGDLSHAENLYRLILKRDERNVYSLANLAAIQLEAGKLDEAEKTVTQALAAAPEDAYSLQTLGYLKFRQGNYDAALEALSRAATANPDSAEIQNYLGVTLSHKGQRAAAETALRRALQLDPGYASAHNNLAVVYSTQEPPAVALARWHYQKALAAGHPKNPELEKFFDKQEAAPVK